MKIGTTVKLRKTMGCRFSKINNFNAHQFSYDIKVFFVRHKTFLINMLYIYIQQELFFVIMYPFSVQHWTYLVSMSLSFGCHIRFCFCYNICFVFILLCNIYIVSKVKSLKVRSNLRRCMTRPSGKWPFQTVKCVRKMFCRMSFV